MFISHRIYLVTCSSQNRGGLSPNGNNKKFEEVLVMVVQKNLSYIFAIIVAGLFYILYFDSFTLRDFFFGLFIVLPLGFPWYAIEGYRKNRNKE
jgi:hypothetical protein